MKSCGNCANYDRTKMEHTEVCEKCVTVYGDIQKEPSKWTSLQQTNADRIRAMSDEELVKLIGHNCLCDQIQNKDRKWCESKPYCDGCLHEWLKQPAEVDNG